MIVAVLAAAIAITAYSTSTLQRLEGSTIDARFSVRGKQPTPSNIVVVKVDDATFQALNLEWPFARRVHARLIERIAAEHPAAIAYDIQFTESSGGSANASQADEVALLNAINDAHGRTVFSTTETTAKGDTRFLGSAKGTKLLRLVGSRPANGLFPFDADGVIRRESYSIGHLKTLAVVTAGVATHRRISSSKFSDNNAWIDYAGPAGTFPTVSFSDALKGRLPPHFFRNKIVVVGATAPSLQDIHPTSTDSQMAGPEIQANAIETVLRGLPLSSVPGWVNIALIVLLSFAVPLVSLRTGPIAATAVALTIGALFTVAVQLAFNSGVVVSFVYPLGGLILSAAGALAVQLVTEAFERLRVRDMFARFVPENVVDEVLASADGLRLGGVQREGTVMFTDLRGFTSMAESLTPARVIEVLNRYLSEMSDAILDHGGTLVAYMGDGIMAVFGAPLPQADHADRALAAAREMLEVRLPRFNQWLRSEELSEGFRMGIGLNSGHVMSGHVGSERRVEYTAVGDTTNTASRIEAMTKGTPHQLFLSGTTKDALLSEPDDLLLFGESEIRGRTAKIQLWSLIDAPERPAGPEPQDESLKASGQAV
ncbi:MAG TPA: adenylate/guanylate cyclase domain-containing protein [Solirubrobacteraceae bacterium]